MNLADLFSLLVALAAPLSAFVAASSAGAGTPRCIEAAIAGLAGGIGLGLLLIRAADLLLKRSGVIPFALYLILPLLSLLAALVLPYKLVGLVLRVV
jgi:hypothetical protein